MGPRASLHPAGSNVIEAGTTFREASGQAESRMMKSLRGRRLQFGNINPQLRIVQRGFWGQFGVAEFEDAAVF